LVLDQSAAGGASQDAGVWGVEQAPLKPSIERNVEDLRSSVAGRI